MIGTKLFGNEGTDLADAIANMTKEFCTELIHDPESIESLMTYRLIPLDKSPGIRPIGIGEVLRRIMGKAVSSTLRNDIKLSAGPLQLCAGQEEGGGGCNTCNGRHI